MRHLLASTLAILLLFVSSQNLEGNTPATSAATADPAAGLKAAYALCSQYHDFSAAAPLAYQLAVVEPAEAGKWKEELAKIHFATQRHATCLKILNDLKANHGAAEKTAVLEMTALCHEALGHKDDAAAAWKAAWEKTGRATHAVRLAGLQFEQGQLDVVESTISAGLTASDAKTATLQLPKTREQMQSVPVAAALHNLRALLILKRDPAAKAAARIELEAALALSPDYEIAKRNLAALSTTADDTPAMEGSTPNGHEPSSQPALPPGTP